MGCCGKTIKKIGQITEGYTNLARGKRFEFTNERIKTCQECEFNYWVRKKLFCSVCKCFIPAKARVDWAAQITRLKELLEAGEITQDIYDKLAAEVQEAMCPKNKWRK